MIEITKSPTADTRTCNFESVTIDTLFASSKQHINDVQRGMCFFSNSLISAACNHDHDKVSPDGLAWFHRDFVTGFKQAGWWDNHRKISRHHLEKSDGVPDDVNLLDVLEYVSDCVMAGMARSGSVYELKLPDELLQRALKNTTEMLKAQVSIKQ